MLAERGFSPELVELEKTARSAQEAAEALGVRVEQIVKSLVFRGARSGRPVLVLASGPNRADEGKVSELAGEMIEKADAAFVREKTGFAIGGVPPVGHAERPVAFVDEDLSGPAGSLPTGQMRVEVLVGWDDGSYSTVGIVSGEPP